MAFISGDSWTSSVINILKQDLVLDCAVAFLGEKSIELFKNRQKLARLICNLDSGVTNPYAVEELIKMPNVKVLNYSRLHAKVYCNSKTCIIGSGNISSNGLALEGSELEGWEEAGIISTELKEINASIAWFNNLWNSKKVSKITKADLLLAKENYVKRRKNRFNSKSTLCSLIDCLKKSPGQLKNAKIYITRCTGEANAHQNRTFRKIKKECNYLNNFEAYIGFSKNYLPKDSHLISFIELDNKIETDGVFQNYSDVDNFFHKVDGDLYLFVAPVKKGVINNSIQISKEDLNVLRRNYWLFQHLFIENKKDFIDIYNLKDIVYCFE